MTYRREPTYRQGLTYRRVLTFLETLARAKGPMKRQEPTYSQGITYCQILAYFGGRRIVTELTNCQGLIRCHGACIVGG